MLDEATITSRKLSSEIKKFFKEKYDTKVRVTTVKTVRGFLGSPVQVFIPFDDEKTMCNKLRCRAVELTYGKPLNELKVHNENDINYGNTRSKNISLYGANWIKVLNENSIGE